MIALCSRPTMNPAQSPALARPIHRLRSLVLTAVDVLLRADRDDEAAGLRRGLDGC